MAQDLDEAFFNYGTLLTEVHYAIGGILISHRATQAKIDEMLQFSWHDPKSGRWINKQRMKQLGGSIMSFQRFVKLNSISSIANFLESFHTDIKRTVAHDLDIWDPSNDSLPHIEDARMSHALTNVIKHNQAVIQRSTSTSARYLVDHCAFHDGIPVELAPVDVETVLLHIYIFALAVIQKVISVKIPLLAKSPSAQRQAFESLVPEVTRLSKRLRGA